MLCKDWQDAAYCESHFEGVHGSKNMNFEAVEKRFAVVGGMDVRETNEEEDAAPPKPPQPVSWMWRDEKDQKGTFITNNFQHDLKR